MSIDPMRHAVDEAAVAQIRRLAKPLTSDADLDPLVARLSSTDLACIGEASHGTHEFYEWRARLTRRLIQEEHFTWIGVEGDWPDCWRINRWVRGKEGQRQSAAQMLQHFDRWPTWMWANRDVADFLDWLRSWNLGRAEADQVGFYGLDVYSLWDSLRETIAWLEAHEPSALPAAMQAWQCFVPYQEDPHRYAWATRLVPETCEADVVSLLAEVLRRTEPVRDREDAFNAAQNAEVANNAERYYRTMVRGDRQSWNVRDRHMVDTVHRIMRHLGHGAKGVIWEHNTHIGDARATDMAAAGMVNVGQLLRQSHGDDKVGLVGFAAHRGTVLAASAWGDPEVAFVLPEARPASHEHLLHHALGRDAVIVFDEDRRGPWLAQARGHRAVGVVYDPSRETGNYVPTLMGRRYDALIWLEETAALRPLHHEAPPREPEFETEPSGF